MYPPTGLLEIERKEVGARRGHSTAPQLGEAVPGFRAMSVYLSCLSVSSRIVHFFCIGVAVRVPIADL